MGPRKIKGLLEVQNEFWRKTYWKDENVFCMFGIMTNFVACLHHNPSLIWPPGFLVEALESSETPWNFLKLRNLLCFFFFINIVILLHTSFCQLWFAAALFMPLKSTKPKSGLICDKSWRTWYLFWFVYLVLLKSSFKVWPWVRLSGSVTPEQISIFLEAPYTDSDPVPSRINRHRSILANCAAVFPTHLLLHKAYLLFKAFLWKVIKQNTKLHSYL